MKKLRYTDLVPLCLRCILCGVLTGGGIFMFRYLATKTETLSRSIYSFAKETLLYIPAVIFAVVLFSFVIFFLHRKIPEIKGGGIPRSEGVLRGALSCRPVYTLLGTVAGSLIGFICGLPIGSEGPAVLIGTCIGGILCGKNGVYSPVSRYVCTGGAGAGFAVATCSPLSAILFTLEEIHKRFTPTLVLSASVCVLSATFVNKHLCGIFGIPERLFDFGTLAPFSIELVGYLLVFGVIIALAVALFDLSILKFSSFTGKIKKRFPKGFGIVLLFLLAGVLGFVFPDALYSGHHLIEELVTHHKGILALCFIFAVRLIMMLFVTGSAATGGIFIPTLALGCLVSAISGKLLVEIGFPSEIYPTLMLLGMCAFIGGTLRAPLTAAVLFAELTGHFSDFFYIAIVVFTVIVITDIFNLVPFYDSVLENLEHAETKGRKAQTAYFELTLSENSSVCGKAVRDIMWPHGSVVVGVRSQSDKDDDTDNDGEKVVLGGDTVIVRAKFYDEGSICEYLSALAGKDGMVAKK